MRLYNRMCCHRYRCHLLPDSGRLCCYPLPNSSLLSSPLIAAAMTRHNVLPAFLSQGWRS